MKRCSPRLAAKQAVPAPDREVSNSRVTDCNSSVDTSDELSQVLLQYTVQPALSLGREKYIRFLSPLILHAVWRDLSQLF